MSTGLHQELVSDDDLLSLAFPEFASQLRNWRLINARLDELCQDFLTLKRSYVSQVQNEDVVDAGFLKHLSEAMEDIGQDIEALLGRMSTARQTKTDKK